MLHKSFSKLAGLLTVLFMLAVLPGCGPQNTEHKPAKLKVFSGAEQYTLPDTEFEHDLVVVAESAPLKGVFGSTGTSPAAN